MSTPHKIDKTSQGLRLISYCPVCEMRSKSMHAKTLGSQGETKLMHITCHKCQNAFLTLVLVNQVGASSVGLLTDLAYEDVVRFHSQKDISVDDVIAAHEFFGKQQKAGSFFKRGKIKEKKGNISKKSE